MNIKKLRGLLIKDGKKATERTLEIFNKMSDDITNGKVSIEDFINIKRQEAIGIYIDYLLDMIDGNIDYKHYNPEDVW